MVTDLSVVAIDGPAFEEAVHFILAANTYGVQDPGDFPPGPQTFVEAAQRHGVHAVSRTVRLK